MIPNKWWEPLLPSRPRATTQGGNVIIEIGEGRTSLQPAAACAFAMQILGLAERARSDERMGAVDGRPLVWSGEGCYLHGDTRPIREGDFLHLCGKAGWLRGGCIAASPVPLLEITRGVLYVRPEYHPAEEPTLFRRVLGG